MLTPDRMQLPAQFLQVQTPDRGGGCGSEDYIHAGNTHFRRDKMTQLIKCTPWNSRLKTSHNYKENEDLSGGGE